MVCSAPRRSAFRTAPLDEAQGAWAGANGSPATWFRWVLTSRSTRWSLLTDGRHVGHVVGTGNGLLGKLSPALRLCKQRNRAPLSTLEGRLQPLLHRPTLLSRVVSDGFLYVQPSTLRCIFLTEGNSLITTVEQRVIAVSKLVFSITGNESESLSAEIASEGRQMKHAVETLGPHLGLAAMVMLACQRGASATARTTCVPVGRTESR